MEITELTPSEPFQILEEDFEEHSKKLLFIIHYIPRSDSRQYCSRNLKDKDIENLCYAVPSFTNASHWIHIAEVAEAIYEIYHDRETHARGKEAERKLKTDEPFTREDLDAYIKKNYTPQRS